MHNKPIHLLLLAALISFSELTHAQTPTQPISLPGAASKVYKTIGDIQLMLHIFYPSAQKDSIRLPAIIFFFGGGWNTGDVNQFVSHSKYLAERGMIAVVADYRVRSRHGVTPFECVSDAKSAIRWLRIHADELGIDEKRITASGGSAGGHLALCTALIDSLDEKNDDLQISSIPNALILFNPVADMTEIVLKRKQVRAEQVNDWSNRAVEISPFHHIKKNAPPTIIFHGTADSTVSFLQVMRFCEGMKNQGNRCEVISFEGRPHGFFNYRKGENPDYFTTLRKADEFLISIGYLKGDPTIK
jgi:acetyl esterase/lipase